MNTVVTVLTISRLSYILDLLETQLSFYGLPVQLARHTSCSDLSRQHIVPLPTDHKQSNNNEGETPLRAEIIMCVRTRVYIYIYIYIYIRKTAACVCFPMGKGKAIPVTDHDGP
jgi:hypothetical protein